ncbi:MAG: hypothetical protein R2711_06980 [Acidimicrobiales bacterium]
MKRPPTNIRPAPCSRASTLVFHGSIVDSPVWSSPTTPQPARSERLLGTAGRVEAGSPSAGSGANPAASLAMRGRTQTRVKGMGLPSLPAVHRWFVALLEPPLIPLPNEKPCRLPCEAQGVVNSRRVPARPESPFVVWP